mmetsp:Transcript_18992/g.47497  ORF Transcript_18992/g.47497 Transcript_18992/m.47497 type:complete len:205 (-) Transcript_18992:304-918(-)
MKHRPSVVVLLVVPLSTSHLVRVHVAPDGPLFREVGKAALLSELVVEGVVHPQEIPMMREVITKHDVPAALGHPAVQVPGHGVTVLRAVTLLRGHHPVHGEPFWLYPDRSGVQEHGYHDHEPEEDARNADPQRERLQPGLVGFVVHGQIAPVHRMEQPLLLHAPVLPVVPMVVHRRVEGIPSWCAVLLEFWWRERRHREHWTHV